MRRVIMIACAAVAMAAYSNRAMAAAHTAAEVHVFFGAPVNADTDIPGAPASSDITSNPNFQLNGGTSEMKVLPIWMRILSTTQGANAATTMSTIAFRVYSSGDTAFLANAGNGNNSPYAGHAAGGVVDAGPGDGSNLSTDATLKQFRSGYRRTTSGAQIGAGTYLLGWVKVMGLATTSNKVINLWFTVGQQTGVTFGMTPATGSLNTIAFGASDNTANDGLLNSGLNTYRRGNTNQDVVGSVLDLASTLPDATITVVPEPTTLGLLALGLLAARRRRLA